MCVLVVFVFGNCGHMGAQRYSRWPHSALSANGEKPGPGDKYVSGYGAHARTNSDGHLHARSSAGPVHNFRSEIMLEITFAGPGPASNSKRSSSTSFSPVDGGPEEKRGGGGGKNFRRNYTLFTVHYGAGAGAFGSELVFGHKSRHDWRTGINCRRPPPRVGQPAARQWRSRAGCVNRFLDNSISFYENCSISKYIRNDNLLLALVFRKIGCTFSTFY